MHSVIPQWYELLTEDLLRIRDSDFPRCRAVFVKYPIHKDSGTLIQSLIRSRWGTEMARFVSVGVDRETFEACYVYGPPRAGVLTAVDRRQLDALESAVLAHAPELTELFGVRSTGVLDAWMVALARTDAEFEPFDFKDPSDAELACMTLLQSCGGLITYSPVAVQDIVTASLKTLNRLVDEFEQQEESSPVESTVEAQSAVETHEGQPNDEAAPQKAETVKTANVDDTVQDACSIGAAEKKSEKAELPESRRWVPVCDAIVEFWVACIQQDRASVSRTTALQRFLNDSKMKTAWPGHRKGTLNGRFKHNPECWKKTVEDAVASVQGKCSVGAASVQHRCRNHPV